MLLDKILSRECVQIKLINFHNSSFSKDNIAPALFKVSRHSPPEILKGGRYSAKIDIWAFGASVLELLTRKSFASFYGGAKNGGGGREENYLRTLRVCRKEFMAAERETRQRKMVFRKYFGEKGILNYYRGGHFYWREGEVLWLTTSGPAQSLLNEPSLRHSIIPHYHHIFKNYQNFITLSPYNIKSAPGLRILHPSHRPAISLWNPIKSPDFPLISDPKILYQKIWRTICDELNISYRERYMLTDFLMQMLSWRPSGRDRHSIIRDHPWLNHKNEGNGAGSREAHLICSPEQSHESKTILDDLGELKAYRLLHLGSRYLSNIPLLLATSFQSSIFTQRQMYDNLCISTPVLNLHFKSTNRKLTSNINSNQTENQNNP